MTEFAVHRFKAFSRRPLRQRGFNLIELIVGIAIISMVMFFAVPSMSAWIQSSQIRNASESLLSGLQVARSEAVRRNTSIQFVMPAVAGGGTASDWFVSCVTPTVDCPGVGMATTEIQKRSATEGSPNAQIIAGPGLATIVFSGNGRMTTPAADAVLDLTNPAGGTCVAAGGHMRCLRIIVTTSGQVRMCDLALANTNPRGC